MGPIPPAFADQRGDLVIAGRAAAEWVETYGSPVFVYDRAAMIAKIAHLRAAFPGIDLHYAIKANPYPPLVAHLATTVDGLDVASGGELALALGHKPATSISFAGPGKTDAALAQAVAAGATLNAESAGEIARALRIGERLGVAPRIAVRVNPDVELRGSGMKMGGRPSPFGIDAERAAAAIRQVVDGGADYRGLHIFAGSQSLDTGALIETQGATLALAERLAEESGVAAPLVNLGGGFGVPYFAGDAPVEIERIGAALAERVARGWTRYAIELGRWLVAEAGVYLTRVVDRKESRGETFLVVDGGLHHQLAASGNFGTVVKRNYPLAVAGRMGERADEEVSVVGCLCTPLDRLGDRVGLPRAEVGDVVAVFLAGAYGLTASPVGFLGHPAPAEVLG